MTIKYFAHFTKSQVLVEVPCGFGFRRFRTLIKDEWVNEGEGPADMYIGTSWEGREYICSVK